MMMQAELKKQAYASTLKSRALSVLLYLIDRSNQDLTCFPAIPTMAEQLHISVSTVKRALKELVEDGCIEKAARSRANNQGQTSNLYTLILRTQTPTPKTDSSLDHEDTIDVPREKPGITAAIPHISFSTLQGKKPEQAHTEATPSSQAMASVVTKIDKVAVPSCKALRTPVQLASFTTSLVHPLLKRAEEKAGQLLPCDCVFYQWTGVEVNLQPP